MVYIVCVIHLLYWTNLFQDEITKSFFLVEMPIIFFVVGISYSYSKTKDNYLKYLKGRFLRLLPPYCIFVMVMTAIFFVYNILIANRFDIFSVEYLKKSLLFDFPYSSAIWFVKVYILTILLAPLIKFFADRINVNIVFLITLGALFFIPEAYIRKYILYGFFFLLGYIYKRYEASNVSLISWYWIIFFVSVAIVSYCAYSDFSFNMQFNKNNSIILCFQFPQYGLFHFCIFCFLTLYLLCYSKVLNVNAFVY